MLPVRIDAWTRSALTEGLHSLQAHAGTLLAALPSLLAAGLWATESVVERKESVRPRLKKAP
jgi:hypothetical protein